MRTSFVPSFLIGSTRVVGASNFFQKGKEHFVVGHVECFDEVDKKDM
jgi:hypothetical protein